MSTQPAQTKRACAGCGRPRTAELEVCTGCGLHFASGLRVQAPAPEPAQAPLASRFESQVSSDKPAPKKRKTEPTREERRQSTIQQYWRSTRLVCFLGTAAGVIGTFAIGSARGMDPLSCLGVLIGAEVAVFASCYGLGFTFLGFEEDLRGLALRTLGIGALWAALLLVITIVPPMTILIAVGMGLMSVFSLAMLIKGLTDREWADSCIMGFAAFVLVFVVQLTLAAAAAAKA